MGFPLAKMSKGDPGPPGAPGMAGTAEEISRGGIRIAAAVIAFVPATREEILLKSERILTITIVGIHRAETTIRRRWARLPRLRYYSPNGRSELLPDAMLRTTQKETRQHGDSSLRVFADSRAPDPYSQRFDSSAKAKRRKQRVFADVF